MKDLELSYIAGAIDHRGKVSEDSRGYPYVSIRTLGSLPKKLKKEFGGTCFRHQGGDKKKKQKPKKWWWYKVTGEKAKILLQEISPFLRRYKREADGIIASK